MAIKESEPHKTAFLREGTCSQHIYQNLIDGSISLCEFCEMLKLQGYYLTGITKVDGVVGLWVGKVSDDIFEYNSFVLEARVTTHFGPK